MSVTDRPISEQAPSGRPAADLSGPQITSARWYRRRPRFKLWMVVLALIALGAGVAIYWTVARPPAKAGEGLRQTEQRLQTTLLRQLNHERREHNLPALRLNNKLDVSARYHSSLMAKRNKMSHRLAGERKFTRRISHAGYRWTMAAENVAFTSRITKNGVRQIQTVMYTERPPNDGHRRNILGAKYRDVGIGVVVDRARHRVWITEDFGRR